jgi:hypothetical protein
MFVGLITKKKKEMPTSNLRKLVDALDTLEDPTLQLKLSSMKRGVEEGDGCLGSVSWRRR